MSAGSIAHAAEPPDSTVRTLDSGERVTVVRGASGREWAQFGDLLVPIVGDRVKATFTGASWPEGRVYIQFADGISATNRQLFLDYVSVWSAASAVQFIPSTDASNRIVVQEVPSGNSVGCGSSPLGMTGGAQDLRISEDCWSRRTIVHEMGHALGMVHEHSRTDRDQYISVSDPADMATRCPSYFTVNWGRYAGAAVPTAYDFGSVMHYRSSGCLSCVEDQPALCVTLSASQAQPAGAPSGSDAFCSGPSACTSAMGTATDASLRDRLGLALRYGQRLTYTTTGDGTGSITFEGASASCGTGCVIAPHGGTLTITATPANGSAASISGACNGASTCSTSMSQNRTATVHFVKLTTVLSVLAVPRPRARHVFADGFE